MSEQLWWLKGGNKWLTLSAGLPTLLVCLGSLLKPRTVPRKPRCWSPSGSGRDGEAFKEEMSCELELKGQREFHQAFQGNGASVIGRFNRTVKLPCMVCELWPMCVPRWGRGKKGTHWGRQRWQGAQSWRTMHATPQDHYYVLWTAGFRTTVASPRFKSSLAWKPKEIEKKRKLSRLKPICGGTDSQCLYSVSPRPASFPSQLLSRGIWGESSWKTTCVDPSWGGVANKELF